MKSRLYLRLPFIGVFCIFFAMIHPSFGAYYNTLPEGVRTLVYHQAVTSDIDSEFLERGQKGKYHFDIKLDADALSSFNESFKSVLKDIKDLSPQAYENIQFGRYEIKGQANVDVKVFGFGYGLNDRITLYGHIPIYDAQVNVDMKRTEGNNHSKLEKTLNSNQSGDTIIEMAKSLSGQLPDVPLGVIQSYIVNENQYESLGNWEARDLGDMEIGMIMRLTDWKNSGLAFTTGLVLPTGREDNPDILQDFEFGDGQTDAFFEFGGGMNFPKSNFSFDTYARYTHQFESEKTLRIPEDDEFPLASRKGKFQEKLGNRLNTTLIGTYHFNDYFEVFGGHLYEYQASSEYDSPYTQANDIHALNSEIITHTAQIGGSFTSIGAYQRGDFLLPMKLTLSAEKFIDGQNSPDYFRYDLDVRFFF